MLIKISRTRRKKMEVKPETTVAELMTRFPRGFSIGPGSPERPGSLSRVVTATSHLRNILANHPVPEGNSGYLYVTMDESKEPV